MSVLRTLFGGSESETVSRPQVIPRLPPSLPTLGTGASQLITGGTAAAPTVDITLDPRIQALRDESLGGLRGLVGDVQGDIQTLRGLESPFVQARTQPFVQARDAAARSAARRGVGGPLAALATNPFERELAQQRTLATAENQAAIARNQQMLQGLLGDISGQGQQMFEQELQLLGLTQQQARDIVASQLAPVTGQVSQTQQEQFGGLFPGGIPSMFSFLGGFGQRPTGGVI